MSGFPQFHASLADMGREVYRLNQIKGWYDSERDPISDLVLIHSEVSEAFEAFREIGVEHRTHPVGAGGREWERDRGIGKPDDFSSEIADVFIRTLDCANRRGIDLEDEFGRKMAYNWTRPLRHGGKKL